MTRNNQNLCTQPLPSKLRNGLAIGIFLVLVSYVSFSSIRLGLIIWQRFA